MAENENKEIVNEEIINEEKPDKPKFNAKKFFLKFLRFPMILIPIGIILLGCAIFAFFKWFSPVKVPDFTARLTRDAVTLALEEKLDIGKITSAKYKADNSVGAAQYQIIEQSIPAGTLVSRGTKIDLVINGKVDASTGMPMPDLTGMTKKETKMTLNSYGFVGLYEGETKTDEDVFQGTVCWQSTTAGKKYPSGILVRYKTASSSGYKKVPDVKGMTLTEARTTLLDAGFLVRVAGYTKNFTMETGCVAVVDKEAAKKGDTITLTLANNTDLDEAVVAMPNVVDDDFVEAENNLTECGFLIEFKGKIDRAYMKKYPAKVYYVAAQSEEEGVFLPKGTTITITVKYR